MTTTKEPVTLSGWYEHTDGTVGHYAWRDGHTVLTSTVLSWDAVPSEADRLGVPPPKDYVRG